MNTLCIIEHLFVTYEGNTGSGNVPEWKWYGIEMLQSGNVMELKYYRMEMVWN